ncbi:MAG: hypothetical protein NC180_08665 [Muribaculaceae bacterium]|nr:hypothetical protein [Muribaculaceae bacterium]
MKRKQISVLYLLAALAMGVTGCGREKVVDYTGIDSEAEPVQGTQKEGSYGETADDFAQLRDTEAWEEVVTGTIAGERVEEKLHVAVRGPETKYAVVMEGQLLEFSPETKKRMANAVLTDAEIYYNDMEKLSKKSLQSMEERYLAFVRELYGEQGEYEEGSMQYQMIQESIDSYEEKIEECKSLMKTAPENPVPVEDFSADNYTAASHGIRYDMSFITSEDSDPVEGYFYRANRFSMNMSDNKSVGVAERLKEYAFLTREAGSVEEDNTCRLTKEEAVSQAEHILLEMGLSELKVTAVAPLVWYGCDETGTKLDSQVYGYSMQVAVAGADGARLYDSGNSYMFQYLAEGEMEIADEGILSMEIDNPVIFTKLTDKVKLLSLEHIKEAVRTELTENMEAYAEGGEVNWYYGTLELGYLWLKEPGNEEHKGSLLPVWSLKQNSQNPASYVYVNAIDGSIIPWENLIL